MEGGSLRAVARAEQADIPVKLLELKIKLAAVEAQLGGVSTLLGRTPT